MQEKEILHSCMPRMITCPTGIVNLKYIVSRKIEQEEIFLRKWKEYCSSISLPRKRNGS
jgi:hypothetical protein